MSLATFFAEQTRDRVVAAVQAVESRTSAELVVVVRLRSGTYPEAHHRAGALLAMIVLLLLLFLPQEFAVAGIPLQVGIAYALGFFAAKWAPPLERLLASRAQLAERTRLAAHAELETGGITKTRGRTGVLVYFSALERRTLVVADHGVEPALATAGFASAERAILDAAARLDPDAFVTALEALGPALEGPLPRGDDDENELDDGVRA